MSCGSVRPGNPAVLPPAACGIRWLVSVISWLLSPDLWPGIIGAGPASVPQTREIVRSPACSGCPEDPARFAYLAGAGSVACGVTGLAVAALRTLLRTTTLGSVTTTLT